MIINSIELENIRSYDKEKIEFPRGITLFEGDIGSGKSTILMGIEFALFGLGSQKPDALLSKRANDGSVILNFEANGQKCEVKRTLKRKGGALNQDPKNTYLKINDELEPLSPTELKQKVLQILNFNEPGDPRSESRIYRYAIFTPQEEMKQILFNSERRLETIRKAFGVEDYKIAVENSKEILRFIHGKIGIFKDRFRNLDNYELELKNSKEIIHKIENATKETETQEKELEKQRKKIHENLEIIREKILEQRDLLTNKNNIERQIEEKVGDKKKISNQIKQTTVELEEFKAEFESQKNISKPTSKDIEEINGKIKEFSEINNTINKLESQVTTLSNTIKKTHVKLGKFSESTIESLDIQLKEISKNRTEKQEKINELQKELKIKQKEESKLETDKEKYENDIQNTSKLGTKCPYCEHELTKDHVQKLEKERKQALLDTKGKLEKASKESSELESKISKLEEAISESDGKIRSIENMIPDLENLTSTISELNEIEKELKQARDKNRIPDDKDLPKLDKYDEPIEYFTALKDALLKYQNAEARISDIDRNMKRSIREIQQYEDDLKTRTSQITELEEKLKEISGKLKKFEEVKEQALDLQNQEEKLNLEIKDLSNMISRNSEKIENEKNKVKEYKEKISESEKWKNIHKKYSNYYEWLNEFFIPSVDKIEKQVLLSIQQNFNETYHRWYSILIDDPTKESRIDENFTPIIEQDGYEQEVGFLSGGEKTSIALAYRLTLNSLMRQESESMKSNLLILDEPTDGFSKTQLAKVKTLLLELKSQQIILVSHEKELETYVDNIFHINKSSGISKVTRLSN